MRVMGRCSFILLINFLVFSAIIGQSFTATTDAREVLEGNYFQITYKLNNAKGSSFRPPAFKNFKVLNGPSTSSQMSIINGKTTQSISYTYSLMPQKVGTFTIGAASINVGTDIVPSNEVRVKVLKADAKSKAVAGNSEGDIFVELELSDSTAYVGQQIVLKYVIFTSVDVRSYNFISESEYDGFYIEELQNFRDQAVRVVRNGKQYVKQTIKAIALFPQQTGRAEIDPAMINLGIAVKSNRPSFFFSTSMKSRRITSPRTVIHIRSAPKGAPESFSGGIGHFRMGSEIDRNSITMDGAVTLTMRIEGDGDGRFIGPPTQPFDGFEIYEPNLLSQENKMINGKVKSLKVYEYLLVPERSGILRVRPEFSYYNVDSAAYQTISNRKFAIRVAEGSNSQAISTEDLNNRIAPMIMNVSVSEKGGNPVFSTVHIGFLSLCSLAFLLIGGIRWRDIQNDKIDPKLLRSQKAQKIAIEKLSVSKKHLDASQIKEFYSTLSESLFEYVSGKLDIATAQISKDNISEIFGDHHLDDNLGATMSAIIKRSEMAIYAGFTPERASEDYETSKQLIIDIEDALKK